MGMDVSKRQMTVMMGKMVRQCSLLISFLPVIVLARFSFEKERDHRGIMEEWHSYQVWWVSSFEPIAHRRNEHERTSYQTPFPNCLFSVASHVT